MEYTSAYIDKVREIYIAVRAYALMYICCTFVPFQAFKTYISTVDAGLAYTIPTTYPAILLYAKYDAEEAPGYVRLRMCQVCHFICEGAYADAVNCPRCKEKLWVVDASGKRVPTQDFFYVKMDLSQRFKEQYANPFLAQEMAWANDKIKSKYYEPDAPVEEKARDAWERDKDVRI
jgi:hypothetical protein